MINIGTQIPSYLIVVIFILTSLMSTIGNQRQWESLIPKEILSHDLAKGLSFDSKSINLASTDFGNLTQMIPFAVLHPSSHEDILNIIKFSYNCSRPFSIAARGRGHSLRGQAMAFNGVVINMRSLNNIGNRINVVKPSLTKNTEKTQLYVDVGGEQLWIDVLNATLEHGLSPRSWTDYLYLSVGGTLSNAGISGQAFRYGPQINNVYEMDVITGKGETVTCSKHINSELFFAVLGGLGQFGIITRARIALQPAPQRVKWARMLYNDFSEFIRDQEHLISLNNKNDGGPGGNLENMQGPGFDYVEGSVMILDQTSSGSSNYGNNWRSSSFYLKADYPRILSLATKNGANIIYCLEVAKYYDHPTAHTVDEEMKLLLNGLNYVNELIFIKDVSYLDFLNRVRSGELNLQSQGLWEVPHPWLNLFVPKSQIEDFNNGVFHEIILRQNNMDGLILIYPTNRNTWDDRMSAIIPNEEIFYSIGLLQSNGKGDWKYLEDQNREILGFCDKVGIKYKQYLPHYETEVEWRNHFGEKWDLFQERKTKYDPKYILSPGQRIFNQAQIVILGSIENHHIY